MTRRLTDLAIWFRERAAAIARLVLSKTPRRSPLQLGQLGTTCNRIAPASTPMPKDQNCQVCKASLKLGPAALAVFTETGAAPQRGAKVGLEIHFVR